MRGYHKYAWVTTAMDEESTIQASILGKSLARVLTMADTIVLVAEEVEQKFRKILAQCFDSVVQVNIDEQQKVHKGNLSTMDLLKISAMNLEMYKKIVIVNPNNLVLQNCDELFKLEKEYYITELAANKDSPLSCVLVMKPNSLIYGEITKLSRSRQFCLTEVFTTSSEFFDQDAAGEIPRIYNSDVNELGHDLELENSKIVTYNSFLEVAENPNAPRNIQEIIDYWTSCWTEIQNNLNSSVEMPLKIKGNGGNVKNDRKNDIAIVGYSCRFPEANNMDEFWELLRTGGDAIGSISMERMETQNLNDSNTQNFKGGFLKCAIDEFDAKFFGISPREAEMIDPQQRLLLEVAWEALENAAIDPHSLKGGNTGVFTGVWQADYESIVKENSTINSFHNVILGNSFSATSARISYVLGLNGPNIATESGCSSSMVALHLACESLNRKETDLGLVMGANLVIFTKMANFDIPVLAKDGHCKTFDEKADGFGRAEGIAVVVLKRLSDAITNRDQILGIIRGSAMSNEGTSSSFGTPSKLCQEIAVRDALKNSGVQPEEVDYVEAHGTGTPVGDPVEFAAISAGYACKRDKPLIVGSVKTNIGHTESVAGLAGLIKVILSMRHGVIPPHRNFDCLNPNINLESIPAILPLEPQVWKRDPERIRIAGVSSFGISGTNVHVLVEEPPTADKYNPIAINSLDSERTHHILNLSAKTENAVDDLIGNYVNYLDENPNIDIKDLTFTANNSRAHFKHRVSVICKDISHLKGVLRDKTCLRPAVKGKCSIAFLFTGQGSQYSGMANGLYKSNIIFRKAFNECCAFIEQEARIDLKNVLWNVNESSQLENCVACQLSIFCVEYSLMRLLFSLGVKPDFVLGHSVGEYAAAVATGIMDLKDALVLLIKRSQLIAELPAGGMIALTTSVEKVKELIAAFPGNTKDDWIDIAAVNSPEEVVVAGKRESLSKFQELCKNNNVRCKLLAASHAFHSRDVDAILDSFEQYTSKINYKASAYQYVSGTTGSFLSPTEMQDGSYWLRHAKEPVNFNKGMQTLAENGCNVFIEIGPRPVLLALGMESLNSIENTLWLPILQQNKDNWDTLLQSLGKLYVNGLDINWASIDPPGIRNKLQLPTYPFQRQKYWIRIPDKNESKQIHPLLGKKVSFASIKETIYSNVISLTEFSYIKDHQVANLVIMPGAAFLEIILAAGKDLLLKDAEENSMHVKDFVIHAALELEEGKFYEIQVVALQKSDTDELDVKIYVSNTNGWKIHSSAVVSSNGIFDSEFCQENIESIKTRSVGEISPSNFYKDTLKRGINFGEAFQSIESVWSLENESLVAIPVKSLPGNLEEYIFHPIVLDAMLQAMAFARETKDSGLFLPIKIDSCFSFGKSFSEVVFAHAQLNSKKNSATVALYNKENDLLCLMSGIRLIRTSIGSFLNNIEGQKNKLPGLFHEIWRPRLGPLQSRVDLTAIPDISEIKKPLEKSMEGHMMKLFDYHRHKLSDDFIYLRLVKMFNDNGIPFEKGNEYTTRKVIQENCISSNHTKFCDRIIDIFVEEKSVNRIENSELWIFNSFPDPEQMASKIVNLRLRLLEKNQFDVNILDKCLDSLWGVLTGKLDPVNVLFSREDMNILDMYTKGADVNLANIRMAKFAGQILNDSKTVNKESATVRIIEIGAGSASTSKEILKVLHQRGISYHYTFTDISPQFFENAKAELSSFEMVDYKLLDIEKDPSTQGFCPNYYDIVVAANVIHATESLKRSIENVRKLLVDGGILLLQEILFPWRGADCVFGILGSYWKFTDFDLRASNPLVSKRIWDIVLTENNFQKSHLISRPDELTSVLVSTANKSQPELKSSHVAVEKDEKNKWLVFCDNSTFYLPLAKQLLSICGKCVPVKHEINTNPRSCNSAMQYVDMSDESEFEKDLVAIAGSGTIVGIIYLVPLDCWRENENEVYAKTLTFCKYLAKNATANTKVLVVTRGAVCTANQVTIIPSGAIIWGMVKNLRNERPDVSICILDLDPDILEDDIDCQEIFFEIFSKNENFVAYRNKKKFVARMVQFNEPTKLLSLPKGRFKIQIPKTKKIDDVSFKPARCQMLGTHDVEIMIRAISLNFRDILVILKPEGYHTLFDAVGSDFAGVVSAIGSNVTKFKIGDEVFGAGEGTAASHIVQNETGAIFHKPSHFNICEASTIPSTYLTAHYCLVTVANLKKGETVLIHVASGGVGLFAIQIAQFIGAKIIVTAGSHRKRSYLRSLGLEHVFHSRDLTFGDEIRKITNGDGVDVVLNSLTSEGFKEATLENCGKYCRFVEIGKINIWTPEDVRNLRPNVDYTIVDLEKVDLGILRESMQNVYKKEMIRPVEYSKFDIRNIRNALNYFMKAKHIGKIVLSMPEITNIGSQLVTKDILFSKDAMYLITGGLGGIGLVVANWMVDMGAKCLVLVGRSAPNAEALSALDKLRKKGCRILTFEVDIGNLQQCENLFKEIASENSELPPLKGVIHSAGVVSDATYANQTWEKYQSVFNAKVQGCLNLHNLTKDLNLEHFVLFSSIVALISPIGQSNHCAANAFMDAFAHYRHSIGLPAQTVNWGAWSEVGVAANYVETTWEHSVGVYPFNPTQGIAALQFVMSRPNLIQLGVVQLNRKELKLLSEVMMGNYYKELVENEETSSGVSNIIQSVTFWEDIDSLVLDDRVVYIKKLLVTLIRETLKLPQDEQINEHQAFPEMGLDSLMFVELKNKLQGLMGDRLVLNAVALVDHPTISGLSDYLAETTFMGKKDDNKATDGESLKQLLKQDSILPENIKGFGNFVNANQVRNIFLTGGTGHLGSHLLEQLSKIPDVNVICIVRGTNVERARKRLAQTIKKYKLSVNFDRISVVKGDVAQDNLGMSPEEYNRLSESVDAVYHLAAKVNFIENYAESQGKIDIRSVNVLGTVNILRFAANIKLKRVFFSSTLMCVNKFTSDGLVLEEFPDDENNAEGLAMGYYMTKFVGEKLIKQAISRGIPCVTIRYPNVVGNSVTGHFAVDKDFIMNILIMSLKLGLIFNSEGGWSFLSADIAAELTVDFLLNNDIDSEIYNLFQPNQMNVTQIVNTVSNLDYKLAIVNKDEFIERLQQESDSPFISLFKSSYGSDFLTSMSDNHSFVSKHFLTTSFSDSQLSHKVLRVIPNISGRIGSSIKGFEQCLLYAESSGILKQLGILPAK